MAGIEKEANSDAHEALDKKRVGVIVGSGMGGLTVFQVLQLLTFAVAWFRGILRWIDAP